MGYDLNLKLELEGSAYLQDLVLELTLEEFCDDGSEPSNIELSILKLLDTDQAMMAKECLGMKKECEPLCNELRNVLN